MSLRDILECNLIMPNKDKAKFKYMGSALQDDDCATDWLSMLKTHNGTTTEFLQKTFVQLSFPVQEGISLKSYYKDVTLRGTPTDAQYKTEFEDPQGITVELCATPAGRLPTISVTADADFITLVQKIRYKNEPRPIPNSMGAALVGGYNNWGRIQMHMSRGITFDEIVQRPELFRDSFMILSNRNYSGVTAQTAGFSQAQWKIHSMAIRREHESAHYMTKRFYSGAYTSIHDEIVADYWGLKKGLGYFDADLFLMFFGVTADGGYRSGGRLENYLGDHNLTPDQLAELCRALGKVAGIISKKDEQLEPFELFRWLCEHSIMQMLR